MSQNNIAIIQLAQVGLTERVAQEQQSRPEIAQQAAQQAAPELLKKQQSTVGETEKSKSSSTIRPEKDGQNASGHGETGDRKRKEEEPDEEPSAAASPWAGNILNVKV